MIRRSFQRIIWIKGSEGENYGIEFSDLLDPNDWVMFNLYASEFFRQRVRVNRDEKPVLPYGERAQRILDAHTESVRRRRRRNRKFWG